MKQLRAACLTLLGLALAALAQAGEVFLETFKSDALGRDYKYTVYLPDDNAKGETALVKEVMPHAEGKYRIEAGRGAAVHECAPGGGALTAAGPEGLPPQGACVSAPLRLVAWRPLSLPARLPGHRPKGCAPVAS